ncbi:hypothetical protein MCOR27_010357 [Pyricularia oryzae]|uniref:Rhodopsin domain-containing protein n=1 Tax=Pyricularia grisea TaxID=148305 RepID=A0ABQ8N558_PYRGI|nr:hypothetical protein MCOR01_011558 [Pyricularia oryzae]KAI6291477.1 hypothetical protein MCOR33_010578 [Pyricularia grisea]KAI6257184.1 hypothetical protein MCOR19_006380 [Pyricularia oryzae]KAI6267998.1 hypothetical protein MCOR27_010357 [Pyricularia oryzae]KAI6277271.1 hypothetical protein MCOR26_005216 [Pyricularia oryzae]
MSANLTFSLPPPPSGIDLSETRVPDIYGALISTWALAALMLGLRATVRRSRGGTAWWDDILAWMALVAATAQVLVVIVYMIPNGTGRHIWAGTIHSSRAWAIGMFVIQLTYVLVLGLAKYSTLCLYWRLFGAEKRNRIPIWIMGGLVTAWVVAILATTVFLCLPVNAYWERFNPENPMPFNQFECGIDSKRFYIGTAIPTVVTNLLLLAMPVPYVWRLRMPTPQKVAVLAVFLFGAILTVVSAVRLVVIVDVDVADPDMTWNIVDSIIWSHVEGNIAILCCCLPTLKPILDICTAGTTKAAERVNRESRKPAGAGLGGGRHNGSSTLVRTPQSQSGNEIPQWLDESRSRSEPQQGSEPGSSSGEVANLRTMTEIKAHRRPPPAHANPCVGGISSSCGSLGRMRSLTSSPTLSRSRSLSRARLAKSRHSSDDGARSDVSSIEEVPGITVTFDVVVSSERVEMPEKPVQLEQLRFSEMGFPNMKFPDA